MPRSLARLVLSTMLRNFACYFGDFFDNKGIKTKVGKHMLGTQLKQVRTQHKLTQQAVADELHVSRQTISSWETGNSYPDVPNLINLSNLYQVSLDTLIKGNVDIQDKIQDDYQELARHRNSRGLNIGLVIAFLCVIIPVIVIPFVHTVETVKWLGIFVSIAAIPLIIISYFKTMLFYPIVAGKQPLIIPKFSGLGLTFNPRHPLGKALWILIVIAIIILIIVEILTPAQLLVHH